MLAMSLGRLLSPILVFVAVAHAYCAPADHSERERKYYEISALDIGPLRLESVKVSLVAVRPKIEGGHEDVPVLHMTAGNFTLRSVDNNRTLMSGQIAEGSADDPAGSLQGQFTWTEDKISKIDLSSLRFRLKHVELDYAIGGSRVSIPANAIAFISLSDPISSTNSHSSGSIKITLSSIGLPDPTINFAGMKVSPALVSSEAVILHVNLVDSAVTVESAFLRSVSAKISVTAKEVVDGVFENLQVGPGDFELGQISLSIRAATVELKLSNFSAISPVLHHVDFPTVPIVAVSRVSSGPLSATSNRSDLSFQFDHPDVKSVPLIIRDPYAIINALNLSSKLTPDSIIPTGDPNLRFTKTSALVQFDRAVAKPQPEGTVTQIYIDHKDDVISGVSTDSVALPNGSKSHGVCVLVGQLSGMGAAQLVNYLLDVAVPEYGGPVMIATWLRVSTATNPRLGVAAAKAVAGASKFLTNKVTKKVVEKTAEKRAENVAEEYCEVLIKQGINPELNRRWGRNPSKYGLQPRLFANLQDPPDQLFNDSFAARYMTYLGATFPAHYTPEELGLLKMMNESEANWDKHIAEVHKQQGLYQEEKEHRLQDHQTRNREITAKQVNEQSANSQANKQKGTVPQQQAREHQAKAEAMNRQTLIPQTKVDASQQEYQYYMTTYPDENTKDKEQKPPEK